MNNGYKALLIILVVYSVLFVPPFFIDGEYIESFDETALRSFSAIFVAIIVWAISHRVKESRTERRRNNRAEAARNRMKYFVLFLMFGGFGVALFCTLSFILHLEGY